MAETNDLTVGGSYFKSSVKKARARLMARADETYEKLLKIIDMATAAGDFETAAKYAWMLIEHTPKEEGESIISESASKPKQVEATHKGPIINIGIQQGGLNEHKALPTVTIDAEPVRTD